MKMKIVFLFVLGSMTVTGWASNVDSIRTAGQIFLLTPTARADGLGGCGALLGEASSGLLNPAAQALMDDVAGSIYYNARPFFTRGRDFLVLSAAAHSDFGYTGINYLTLSGFSNSNQYSLRPEEATSVLISGRAWRKMALGIGFKILTTQKNQFPDVSGTITKNYKMAFDLGLIYANLLPGATLGQVDPENDEYRQKFGRRFNRGFNLGAAFQNLGGRVEYSNIDVLPLPQTFRADLLWGAWQHRYGDVRILGQMQKILVERESGRGYKSASAALFSAWNGGGLEGSWIARLGLEISTMNLISARIGWSRDHGAQRAYNHLGLGLGPEWLRADLAWIHEPDSDFTWWNGFRLDAAANLTYEKLRRWMKM